MIPRLLLLTDRRQLPSGRDLVATVAVCVAAGLTHVLVRELDLPTSDRTALVRDLASFDGLTVWSAHAPLPGARGVHLPATAPVPSWSGPWGRSCHRPAEVAVAAADGASWVTLSPFADSASKPGRDLLPRSAFAGHAVPVLALGGLTSASAEAALAAGAHGVAVMGAVMRSPDPFTEIRSFLSRTAAHR